MAVYRRQTDYFLKAQIKLKFQPPDLEIVEAEAILERLVPDAWRSAPELIKKVEGVRIGSGLRKIVQGLLGGENGCALLSHAILECSNAVILNFTRPGVQMLEGLSDE